MASFLSIGRMSPELKLVSSPLGLGRSSSPNSTGGRPSPGGSPPPLGANPLLRQPPGSEEGGSFTIAAPALPDSKDIVLALNQSMMQALSHSLAGAVAAQRNLQDGLAQIEAAKAAGAGARPGTVGKAGGGARPGTSSDPASILKPQAAWPNTHLPAMASPASSRGNSPEPPVGGARSPGPGAFHSPARMLGPPSAGGGSGIVSPVARLATSPSFFGTATAAGGSAGVGAGAAASPLTSPGKGMPRESPASASPVKRATSSPAGARRAAASPLSPSKGAPSPGFGGGAGAGAASPGNGSPSKGSPYQRVPRERRRFIRTQATFDGDHLNRLIYEFASWIACSCSQAKVDGYGRRVIPAPSMENAFPMSQRFARQLDPVTLATTMTIACVGAREEKMKLTGLYMKGRDGTPLPLPDTNLGVALLMMTAILCTRRGAYAAAHMQRETVGDLRYSFLLPRNACQAAFIESVYMAAPTETHAKGILADMLFDEKVNSLLTLLPLGPGIKVVYEPALVDAGAFLNNLTSASLEVEGYYGVEGGAAGGGADGKPEAVGLPDWEPTLPAPALGVSLTRFKAALARGEDAWSKPANPTPHRVAMPAGWMIKNVGGLAVPALVDRGMVHLLPCPLTPSQSLDPSLIILKVLDTYGTAVAPILEGMDLMTKEGHVMPLPPHPAETMALVITALVIGTGGTGALHAIQNLEGGARVHSYRFLSRNDAYYPALCALVAAAAGPEMTRLVFHRAPPAGYPWVTTRIVNEGAIVQEHAASMAAAAALKEQYRAQAMAAMTMMAQMSLQGQEGQHQGQGQGQYAGYGSPQGQGGQGQYWAGGQADAGMGQQPQPVGMSVGMMRYQGQ